MISGLVISAHVPRLLRRHGLRPSLGSAERARGGLSRARTRPAGDGFGNSLGWKLLDGMRAIAWVLLGEMGAIVWVLLDGMGARR